MGYSKYSSSPWKSGTNIVINKIKDEIKLLLYNNRHMVNIQKITDNTNPVGEILLT